MLFRNFISNKSGGVSVEASFVLMLVIILTGGTIEAGYAFWQWNGAQQAARHGARLAVTSNPVAQDIRSMTGLGNGVEPGDPMPDYIRTCSGLSNSCNQGSYNTEAMNALIFGPDRDMTCGSTIKERRGICDVFGDIEKENVEVIYENSGLGRAGFPANPAPLVTVKVTDIKFNFLFLDIIMPSQLTKMPDVSVSLLSEDLRSGL